VANRFRRLFARFSSDRGSAALLIPVSALLFCTATAMAVDVGLFVNDRRDAQATVDQMALAGALELTMEAADDGTVGPAAIAEAQQWGLKNELDLSDPDLDVTIQPVRTCYSANDGFYTGVEVTIERTPTMALLDYFGTSWRSGATALACAGRPSEMRDFLPFAISEIGDCFTLVNGQYQPKIGERCVLQIDNDGGTSLHGQLGIQPGGPCNGGNSSSSVLRDNIINGVDVNCSIGESVTSNPGNSSGPVRDGLQARLQSARPCDANSAVTEANLDAWTAAVGSQGLTPLAAANKNNNVDDLFEVWERNPLPDPLSILPPYDCDPSVAGVQTSPRNVNIIVVHDILDEDGGNHYYIVRGFVRMYIEGCERNGNFYVDCTQGGGNFNVYARIIDQLADSTTPLGMNNYGDLGIYLKR
jgi:hypothetical protein